LGYTCQFGGVEAATFLPASSDEIHLAKHKKKTSKNQEKTSVKRL